MRGATRFASLGMTLLFCRAVTCDSCPVAPGSSSILQIVPGTAAAEGGEPRYGQIAMRSLRIATNNDCADVYYPDSESPPETPYPLLIVLQGANVERSNYSLVGRTLASYGFFVIVPNDRSLFGLALLAEMSQIDAIRHYFLDDDHLAGYVDLNRTLVVGHSYGGATALFAVQGVCPPPFCFDATNIPAGILGIVTYGSDLVDPFTHAPPEAIETNGVPVAIITGELDSVSDIVEAQTTFNAIISGPKARIRIAGANHFGICDANNPAGTITDPAVPVAKQEVSAETIGRWAAMFLRAYALGDDAARTYVEQTGPALDREIEIEFVTE